MTLDFGRVAALLARLPPELQPNGALQVMDLAMPFEPNPIEARSRTCEDLRVIRLDNIGAQHGHQADIGRGFGVGFAAITGAEAAILAGADLDAFGIAIGRTGVARR